MRLFLLVGLLVSGAVFAEESEFVPMIRAQFIGVNIYGVQDAKKEWFYGKILCFGDGQTMPISSVYIEDRKGVKRWISPDNEIGAFTLMYVSTKDPAYVAKNYDTCP